MRQVYVVVSAFDGSPRYYARHQTGTDSRTGVTFSQPFFVEKKAEAKAMGEDAARLFVRTLRNEFKADPYLESPATGERIDVGRDGIIEPAKRTPMAATLDDENSPGARWFVVRPADTPQGPKWFVRVKNPRVPGEPTPVYGDSPLDALQKAKELGLLDFAVEPYVQPAPPAPTQAQTNQPRSRPGSF